MQCRRFVLRFQQSVRQSGPSNSSKKTKSNRNHREATQLDNIIPIQQIPTSYDQ